MATKTMSEIDAFNAGLIAALAVVAAYDKESLFHEIINTTDVESLVDFAIRDEAMEFSGLAKYGYGNKEQP